MKILKPRNTLVTIVEVKDAVKKTEAGIIVPGSGGNEFKLCEVVALGPGNDSDASKVEGLDDLKAGQTVLVKLSARVRGPQGQQGLSPLGMDYKDESGRELKLVEQTNIVAIIEEDGRPAELQDISEEEAADIAGSIANGNLILTTP